MTKKDTFLERTFGDDSRNPFPDKNSKSVQEAFDDCFPKITDDELDLCINDPVKLSKARLEFITANVENDSKLNVRFQEMVKANLQKNDHGEKHQTNVKSSIAIVSTILREAIEEELRAIDKKNEK